MTKLGRPRIYSDEERVLRHREANRKLYWRDIEKTRLKGREKRERLYWDNPEKYRERARKRYWDNIEESRKNNRDNARKHNNTRVERTRERRWKRKLEIVELLGGKCVSCEFDNILGLTFHHTNGKEHRYDWLKKDFDIYILDLLFHNCHNILHITDKMKTVLPTPELHT